MDALKKFLQKKKTDKTFKNAGPGQKLTAEGGAGGNIGKSQHQSSSSSGGGHGHGRQGQQKSQSPGRKTGGVSSASSEEKRAAAAAALARLEKNKKPGDVDSDKLRASRQMAFIKERARRELEAEKELKASTTTPPKDSDHHEDHDLKRSGGGGRSTNPEAMAVSGVFFTCALIGPEILPKHDIEENIKHFLLDQPEEELGVTACLLIHSCNKPFEKVTNCVDTLCKYLDNIISNPTEQKFRRIRCSNKVFQEKVLSTLGAEQFLRGAGFNKVIMKADPSAETEEEFWVFQPHEDDEAFTAALIELRDMLKQTTPIKPELDRNLQVLMPTQVTSRRELPDEFYALSLEEVKREQQIKTQIAENATSLRTKAMRERDELKEQRLYHYGIMRIRFPDGLTLQGTFKAHEKLSNLYDFVQENLVQNVKFELVRSGGEPLTDLDSTLAELKLPPSSILNFKVDSAPAPLATGEISFLKPDVLELVQSF